MCRRVSRSPAGAPRTMASPPVGRASPSRSLTAVVLPAPFGPRNPKTSPRWTVIDSPWSATVRRYRLRSSMAWTAGDAFPAGPAAGPAANSSVSSAVGSAELAGDIQHVLPVEQARHGVDDAVAAFPDDPGGGTRRGGDQHPWRAVDLDLPSGCLGRNGHRQDGAEIAQQPDLLSQAGGDARPGEQEGLQLADGRPGRSGDGPPHGQDREGRQVGAARWAPVLDHHRRAARDDQ